MTQTIDNPTTPGWQTPPPPPPPAPPKRAWYKKRWVWALAALAVIIIAASGSSSSSKPASNGRPLPTGSDQPATTATTTAPTTAPTSAPAKVTPTTAKPTPTTVKVVVPVVNSCDRVREALLTGTQAQINSAMAALQVDKAEDATAREYADYYLHRDAGNKQLRDMDISLIRMACS